MTIWNGATGQGWVALQDVMERMLQPLEDVLVAAASDVPAGSSAVDVGCGAGSTTVALARQLRLECTGVDVSEAMIEAARARGENVRFVCADAQRHTFEPGRFDLVASRFGVMFFDDPVAAFANLRRAATPGAALRFVAWRQAEENPFMTTAERAAPASVDIPARDPDGPGQFAFGDELKVRGILSGAGWTDIALSPVDVTCSLPRAALHGYLARLGPLGLALAGADEETRDRVITAVLPAFGPFIHGDEIQFEAACWSVAARA